MTLANQFGAFGLSQFANQAQQQNQLAQARQNLMGIQQLAQGQLMHPSQFASQKEPEIDVSELPLETKFGEIIGWRAWKFENGLLLSPYTGMLWPCKQNMTAEFKAKSQTPFSAGGGFFAHKVCEGVFEQESDWVVVGTVLLWGEVVEHENGFRAEHARIETLDFFASAATDSFRAWLKQEYEPPK